MQPFEQQQGSAMSLAGSGPPPPPGYYGPPTTGYQPMAGPPPQMPPPNAGGGYPPPGMVPVPPPAYQQQQPIRLARFPGDALHAGPPPPGPFQPPAAQMYAAAAGQIPQSRAASAGGSGAAGPGMQQGPGGSYPPPPGMQPFQPMMMMAPGASMGSPQRMMAPPPPQQQQPPFLGGMQPRPPPGSMSPFQGQLQRPPPIMMPMQPGMYGPQRSGNTTPKGPAGSGATTPMHPMQRTLSGGQLVGFAGGPPMQQQQHFQPPLMTLPPPGIVLPESLSPGSPAALRGLGAAGGGGTSSPASRVQSATQLAAHSRAGTHGSSMGMGGLMEPLHQGPRAGLVRAGSAGSAGGTGSLRSSMDLGSPARRTSDRAAMGAIGGGVATAAMFGQSPSKAPSVAGSRAGSAGRRGGSASASAAMVAPELDENDNIKVAVRVRPPNAQELARGDAQALFVNPSDYRQIQLAVPAGYSRNGMPSTRNFSFHACLNPASRQQDVLRLCGITQLLDAAMDGYNATILAYGQTGSGKTYTMSGREEALVEEGYAGDSDDGIIARSVAYLFEQLVTRAGDGGSGSGDGCRYALRASYAEIYNEQIYDLIRFDKKQLQVRWDTSKGFHVPDLLCKECSSLDDTLRLLSLAARHRRVGSHELNMESSRSHSIFTVYVDCTPMRPDDHEYGMTRYGKVSFVDLAGSERLRDSKSAGETLKETTNINRSLFMLGKVIAALADGAQGARVPYRESKLTKLLMDSLGGSSLSLLIACCSPSAAHIEETLSTLSYAARAKNIRNQPAVQVDPEQAALSALKREVKLLRSENAYLREQLFQANLPRGQTAGGAGLPAGSLAVSRLPSSHGQPPGTPGGGMLQAPSAPAYFDAGTAAGSANVQGAAAGGNGTLPGAAGSRPASGGMGLPQPGGSSSSAPTPGASAASVAAPAAAGAPSTEDLMRRLLETQRMLVQFSRENDRLSGENGRLRTGKNVVANDYKGALEEVEWLRTKLETLETALLAGSLDSGLLAALDGTGSMALGSAAGEAGAAPFAADVLEAAHTAVLGADGLGLPFGASVADSLQGQAAGTGMVLGLAAGRQLAAGTGGGAAADGGNSTALGQMGGLLSSIEPLASMLATAAQSATATADKAVAEATAAAAALAAADAEQLARATGASGSRQGAGSYTHSEGQAAGSQADGMQAEQEQQQQEQQMEGKAPLIDAYLVANPSELREAHPAAATSLDVQPAFAGAATLGQHGLTDAGGDAGDVVPGATATVVVISRPATGGTKVAEPPMSATGAAGHLIN